MKNSLNSNSPLVSVIIPCHNEEKFIDKCLESIIKQSYPKDKLEVLVVDGKSEDGTREILEKYIEKYPFIRLLDNPKRITPCALNLGIKDVKGELILWMSAHNKYDKEYILKCITYMERFSADAVGGAIKVIPRNDRLIDKMVCDSLSHPFGVGSSIYRTGALSPQWVDTAFGICYKKEVFDKIGLFNEKLIRGQDMEFSLRMKKAGLKILLAPEIISYYYARSDLKTFIRHNFKNGLWAILPFKFTTHMPVSWRHLVPLTFVLSIIGFGLLGFFSLFSRLIFLLIISLYFLCNLYFCFRITVKEKKFKLLFPIPFTFFCLHFCYGLGSFFGLAQCLFSVEFWNNLKIITKNIKGQSLVKNAKTFV